jgi:hypothetical protein
MKVEIKEHQVPLDRINALIEAFDGHCKIEIGHHETWCVLDLHIMKGVELSFFSVHVSNRDLLPKELKR